MIGFNKKKILIVEDDITLQKILFQKIKELGVEVITSETAQQALTIIKMILCFLEE